MDLRMMARRAAWRFGLEVTRRDPRRTPSALLPALFSTHAIDCVIDVGAHHGEFGAFLRSIGYGGQVVSFEPVSQAFHELKQRASTDPNWTVHQFALGGATEELDINIAEGSDLSSFLAPMTETLPGWARRERTVVREERVQVCRLDDIYQDVVQRSAKPNVFLKMDTQGWDIEVLKGASGIIDDIRMLQTEVSFKPLYLGMPDFCTSIRAVQQAGFDVVALFPVALVQWASAEFDCIATKSLDRVRQD